MLVIMRLLLLFTFSILMFYGTQVALLSAEPTVDENAQRMAVLIKQLSDEQFANRESAGKELVALGESALPAIRNAMSKSEDNELRFRAKQVIRRIISECSVSKSTGLEMAVIDVGEFLMGSPAKEAGHRDDELQHQVRISQPFLLGKHEVTQDQFRQVMGVAPSYFAREGEGKESVPDLDTSDFPVEQVSWFDAIVFCNRLSKQDGYSAYYKISNVQRDGESKTVARADVTIAGGNGYRLPTEAEWEYACRAGTNLPFHFGTVTTGREANLKPRPATVYGTTVNQKSLGRTARVGNYKPNAWGLFDMHGNVAEWCWDWYDKDYYADSPLEDPHGPNHGHHRVLRGGSWLVNESSCRCANRFYLAADERKYFVGFRVARTP